MSFRLSGILSLFAWVTASGQPAALLNSAANAPTPLAEIRIIADIVEPKLNGHDLAALYRQFTGRRVMVSPEAAAAVFSFVYTASPDDPLTYGMATDCVRKSAGVEGFGFIEDEKDATLDTLVPFKTSPGGCRFSVYDESAPLPEGDWGATYVMRFKHISPIKAAAALTKRHDATCAEPPCTIEATDSAVVINANLADIRKFIAIKPEIDKPAPAAKAKQ